ncbi:MAG: hypothetical protein GW767_04385 [Rhodobacterales bacterium]|nr:hypothetical protein [Rhodobacterales bacterium]
MTISRFSLAFSVLAGAACAQGVTTPSGQEVTLFDVRVEDAGVVRFRFLAPAIDPAGQGLVFDDVAGDFGWLCETVALPALAQSGRPAQQVVISLSDREVAFGQAAPEATQFFEAYALDGSTCIWQAF